ncbi:MAG: TerB N-terminal domain-containing protein [Chloroflexota bacterium]|nr:TerB N-terminal domain-containing protein [Chloroflexota bacterium]
MERLGRTIERLIEEIIEDVLESAPDGRHHRRAERQEPTSLLQRGSDLLLSTPESCWVPAGRPVTVAGYTIEGGLIYVGRQLTGVGKHVQVEPALIDPSLPIRRGTRPSAKTGNGYYGYYVMRASYKELSPSQRGAYLEWLAGGRQDPTALISYVMLFFYGLERRLLADTARSPEVWHEADQIIAEVRRLRRLHSDYSIRDRVDRFLDVVGLLRRTGKRVYESPPPDVGRSWELPLQLKVGLGQLVADGKPIPADWGLAWLRAHPEVRLLTAAQRCREEFERLWTLRYPEHFGEGLRVKKNKRRLTAKYYPASPSFGRGLDLPLGDIPDVGGLTSPVSRLQELADRCSQELDTYSRWIGKHTQGRDTVAAIALLPPALRASTSSKALTDLKAWLEGALEGRRYAVLDGKELLAHWREDQPAKLNRAESSSLLRLLAELGYGMEPDIRLGGPTVSEGPVVLFRLDGDHASTPGAGYETATLLMDLAALVGDADGGLDDRQRAGVLAYVDEVVGAGRSMRNRLHAHLEWRLVSRAKPARLRARLAEVAEADRPATGRFLVGVAAADGHISPNEIDLLSKLYRWLELPSSDLFGQIHAASVAPVADGPVTVRAGIAGAPAYAIPPKPVGDQVVLDRARVSAGLAEAEEVGALLGAIFSDEDGPVAGQVAGTLPPSEGVAGLDAAHTSLLRALAAKPEWSRDEVEALARERGLLPQGALDTINEAALEATGEPACEGDDPIEMNGPVMEELLG